MRSSWISMKLRPLLALAAVGSLGALVGCVVTNKDHCALTGTSCVAGTMCSVCAVENNGCVDPETIADDCKFAGATSSTGLATTTTDPTATDTTASTLNPSTTSTSDPTTSVGPTTEPTTLTGPDTEDTVNPSSTTTEPPCLGNADCGGTEPYCVDSKCISCTALDCVDVEPTKPTCMPSSGYCVECLTSNDCTDLDKPACDPDTANCVACTEHEQCPNTACNLETGQCFPDGEAGDVLYVYNEINFCSDNKLEYGLTIEKPICTLSTALNRVVAGNPTTIKLKSSTKTQSLPSALTPGNFIVAIVPYDAQVPALRMTSSFPALTLQPGNTVFMLRIGIYNLSNVSEQGILCTGARLWLDRQRISSAEKAILADNCQVHLRRTIIFANSDGGLEIGGSDPAQAVLWLENSFLTENNGAMFGGLRLTEAATAKLLYTTVALNKSPVPQIDCAAGWSGKLEIRNSAIVDPGTHFAAACGNVAPVTSFESVVGNKEMLKLDTFTGYQEGFYAAKKGGLLEVALRKAMDPASDYNDTKRPEGQDYAGGDRPE